MEGSQENPEGGIQEEGNQTALEGRPGALQAHQGSPLACQEHYLG